MEDPFANRTAGIHLPQWSRLTHLETFSLAPSNRQLGAPATPILPPIDDGRRQAQQIFDDDDEDDDGDAGARNFEARRIVHLEKTLNFLRIQHEEMLASLQSEIERLRQENKDLQYRLVMAGRNSGSAGAMLSRRDSLPAVEPQRLPDASSQGAESAEAAAGQVGENIQEQLQLAQRQLADEKRQRQALQLLLEQQTEQLRQEKTCKAQMKPALSYSRTHRRQTVKPNKGEGQELRQRAVQAEAAAACPPELQLRHLRIRFDPLRIAASSGEVDRGEADLSSDENPHWRAPSLLECEALVKQLTGDNRRQAGEIDRLKAELKEAVYYGAYRPHRLPSLAVRPSQQQQQQQHPPHLMLAGENLLINRHYQHHPHQQQQQQQLPALTNALATAAVAAGGRAAERRRRTQILRTGKQ